MNKSHEYSLRTCYVLPLYYTTEREDNHQSIPIIQDCVVHWIVTYLKINSLQQRVTVHLRYLQGTSRAQGLKGEHVQLHWPSEKC
jgi:hypothetical protein